MEKISFNAYFLDLPNDMSISNIFNVADLTLYHGQKETPPRVDPIVPLPTTSHLKKEIENVLDDQVISTQSSGYQKFLVK